MEDEDVWKGAKTAAKLVGGVMLAFSGLVLLDFYGIIDTGLKLDPQLLIFTLGAFMAAGLASYMIDRIEWI